MVMEMSDEYIKKEDTIKAMDTWDKFGCDGHGRLVPYTEDYVPYVKFDDMLKAVEGQHSADVAPVVRCKDCKYREMEDTGMVYCGSVIGGWTPDDWYCADGERTDNEID